MSSDAPSDEVIETARKLFSRHCEFVIGAASLDAIPATHLPEVAFIGRSNVGKSSLINALTHRKALARTSQTPGRTRQLNFFDLDGQCLLVDLPGYGYAKASKREVKGFNQLIRDYLRGRVLLKRAFVLIDARHGLKENDIEMMRFLDDLAVVYQIVLTKCDKVTEKAMPALLSSVEAALRRHPAGLAAILTTSSETGFGVAELRVEAMRAMGITEMGLGGQYSR
jgi:GTP-binding protein